MYTNHPTIQLNKFNFNAIHLKEPVLLNNGKSRMIHSSEKHNIKIGSINDIKMTLIENKPDSLHFQVNSPETIQSFNDFESLLCNCRQSIYENYSEEEEWLKHPTSKVNMTKNLVDKIIEWDKDNFIVFKKSKEMKILTVDSMFSVDNNNFIKLDYIPSKKYNVVPTIQFNGIHIFNGIFKAVFKLVSIILVSENSEPESYDHLEEILRKLKNEYDQFDLRDEDQPDKLIYDIRLLAAKILRIQKRNIRILSYNKNITVATDSYDDDSSDDDTKVNSFEKYTMYK